MHPNQSVKWTAAGSSGIFLQHPWPAATYLVRQLSVRNRGAAIYLVMLVVGSLLVAAYAAVAGARGIFPSHAIAFGWPATFLFLLVLWLVEDSKSYPAIYKPFEFGFLAYLVAPLYLPYYLWRTRRFLGILLLLGFVVLYYLGSLAKILLIAES